MSTESKKVQLWNLIHSWLIAEPFFDYKKEAYQKIEDFVFEQEEKTWDFRSSF